MKNFVTNSTQYISMGIKSIGLTAMLLGVTASDRYTQDFKQSLAQSSPYTLEFIETSQEEVATLSTDIESKFISLAPDNFSTGSVLDNLRTGYSGPTVKYAQLRKLDIPIPRKRAKQKPRKQKRELFGATFVGFGKIAAGQRFSNYIKALSEKNGQLADFCEDSKCLYKMGKLKEWLDKNGSGFEPKLKLVNRYVNRSIAYKSDTSIHGRMDRWSLPSETLKRGAGDCEDYAILKMGLLSKLGVPKKAMSVIVLEDTDRRLYHAVLAVRTNVGTFILDNARSNVVKDNQISSYKPLYSVGAGGNHVFGYKRSKRVQVASSVNLSKIAPGAELAELVD